MPSRAISGKPGGGKSYLAVSWLIDELVNTERPIVTNLHLNEEGLADYLAKHYPDKEIDVYKRITRLDVPKAEQHAKMSAFWRYRGNGLILPNISDDDIKKGVRPDEEAFGGGVAYYLDELHKFLNARQWAQTGPLLLWYITQHRHFGDDVVWISQKILFVDAQWRGVTQDYTYVRNFSKEKWRGFTKGEKFHADTFLEPFTGMQTPQESKDFKPDFEGIGNCYHTSIAEGQADKGKKQKGLPIWLLYVGVGLIALIVCLLFIYGPGAVSKWLIGGNEVKTEELRRQMGVNNPSAPAVVGNKRNPGSAPLDTPNLAKELINLAVPLQNITAGEALSSFTQTSGQTTSDISLHASPFGNALIVTGTNLQNVMATVEAVKLMDQAKPVTIMVQAVVLRTVKGRSSSVGVWQSLQEVIAGGGFGLGSISFDPVAGIVSMGSITAAQEVIRILGSQNVGRNSFLVESRPILAATSGQEAWFTSGKEVPVSTTTQNVNNSQTSVSYKAVQFSLGVLPSLMPDGAITVNLKQSNGDVVSTSVIDGNQVPTVASQSLFTRLTLREGQIAIIGGISVTTKTDDKAGFPLLGQIPPLSWVFGKRDTLNEESELLIMLTVYRVPDGVNPMQVRKAIPVKQFAQNARTVGAAGQASKNRKK